MESPMEQRLERGWYSVVIRTAGEYRYAGGELQFRRCRATNRERFAGLASAHTTRLRLRRGLSQIGKLKAEVPSVCCIAECGFKLENAFSN